MRRWTRRTWLLGLLLGLAGAACSGLNVGDASGCAEACARAATCGFLPSALGWSEDEDLAVATEDCTRRCGNSPRSDATVSALLTCLGGEQTSTSWCADAESDLYDQWEVCAGISECFVALAEDDHGLVGLSGLSVSLISFTDYDSDFAVEGTVPDGELTTIAALYTSSNDLDAAVTSCTAALCSPALCAASEVDRPCDDTLCRKSTPAATQVCNSMGIERMLLLARQPGKMQVRLTMFDEQAENATNCSMATTAELSPADYGLVPGPVMLGMQVTGTLAAVELAKIGYEGAAEIAAMDPEADPPLAMRYCLQFSGPSVLLRAGSNSAVLPVGDIAELIAAGLDASVLAVCPM